MLAVVIILHTYVLCKVIKYSALVGQVLYLNNNQQGMRNIKFANAKQAKEIYLYKNVRTKLHKMKAAIWYNKTCKQFGITKLASNYSYHLTT
jgi:hypothetical protein